jgi:hypothetical protein
MFKKKNCKRCGNKINNKYDFCPHCGNPLNENFKEDWGILGRSDFPEKEVDMFSNSLFNSINSGVLGKMLGSAIKMLEKEMQKTNKEPLRKTEFQLYINGKKINPKNIRVVKKGKYRKNANIEKIPKVSLSEEKIKQFSNLPKKEPSSNMKRLSDNLVYEINVPGVESINDIIISRLENSIEIKALAKDKVYSKLIPVNLPIKKYNLSKDKLTIYLDTK